MRAFFEEASVYVAPIIAGAGLKNKILEAWAMARPVVSTTMGGYGLEAVDGDNLFFADTPRVFADKVVSILKNPELGRKLANNGRRTVEQHYSWKTQSDKLGEIFREVLEEGLTR
jgi:glycosyltransferase involved in cell wall biosynthesis